ncbi:transposase [Fimbriiglobus ruber]|uniref:transposase n=1 Tax=Fimbriiglobus ruber TaxID=1908690 RepID=UPI003B84792C
MAGTVRMHRPGVLNYHRCPISTGPLEGVNNQIRTLQRQAGVSRSKVGGKCVQFDLG